MNCATLSDWILFGLCVLLVQLVFRAINRIARAAWRSFRRPAHPG